MKQHIINEIIAYFEEHEELFNDCIEELDSYNGYLGDYRYFEMDMLDELFCNATPTEILNRAYFGHDEDTWTTDAYGNKSYGAFNPNREYFNLNGYGNLVSTNYKDYSAYLDAYAIEDMYEHREYIDAIDDDDELAALFDELDTDDEI